MIYLSASLIKDFLACPKRTFYRVNFSGDSEPNQEMIAGTIVHEVLEKSWQKKDEAVAMASVLINQYNMKKNTDKIYLCIDNFFKSFRTIFSEGDSIEKYFKIPYKEGVCLVGRIDRIHNGVLYDWKTSYNVPEDLNHDVQFIMYHLAYKKLYGKEPTALFYASLQRNRLFEYKPIKYIEEEFENLIIPRVINSMKHRDLPRTGLYNYGTCNRCPFKGFCFKEIGIDE